MVNNYSVNLDGNDGFSAVDHSDFKPTGNWTVGGYFKISSASGQHQIFASNGDGSPNYSGFGIYIRSDGKVGLDTARNTGTTNNVDYKSLTSPSTYTDGAWHWMVGVYDGSKVYIYIDGSEVVSESWSNAVGYEATNYVRVGCWSDGSGNYNFFPGNLDEVFLINGTAWSSTDVTNNYQKFITGATNLKAYYQLENNGDDSSGNSHTLTDISDPAYQTDVPFVGDVILGRIYMTTNTRFMG
jgi:hypothetical protein